MKNNGNSINSHCDKRLSKKVFGIFDNKIYVDINSYESDIKLHRHEFYEIVYVMRGTATHIINGEKQRACTGDLFLLNYNTAHTFEEMSHDFKITVISFLPELIDESLTDSQSANDMLIFLINREIFENESNNGYISLHASSEEFGDLLGQIYNQYISQNEYKSFILKNLLSVVLCRIYRMAFEKYQPSGNSFAEIKNYINNHYCEPLHLKELARTVMLSPSYLSAKFKLKFGVSISDYISAKRIEKACELILKTDKPVSAVMNEVGINDSKFFYKTFKFYTGMTPGDYRKANRRG